MRLTYTALATLAALLSCSDSVPTAGNPKAVLKHDVSLVARGTGGDDNGADGKRLLRNAHAQDESQDSQLFEERSVALHFGGKSDREKRGGSYHSCERRRGSREELVVDEARVVQGLGEGALVHQGYHEMVEALDPQPQPRR
uniref:RxLR effector protein n=1 Tax=Hyaloperonospora arabidopsidis (strain Emoy2) TaxID=559515 RepID=M4C3L1_HYAAE